MDITYIPMARGIVYLAVVLDRCSRRVLSWRLSIIMGRHSASRRWRMPRLVTARRRSSLPTRARSSRTRPSPACSPATGLRSAYGKGAWRDDVFVERLWRSVKYEEVYLTLARLVSARLRQRVPGPHSDPAASTSTMQGDRMRALTTPHPIKPTSSRCPCLASQSSRGSTYRGGKPVQTTGTTSDVAANAGSSHCYRRNDRSIR